MDILRKFRDAVLSRSHWGRTLVGFYYQHSPALNRLLAGHDLWRRTVAIGLVPPMVAIAYVTFYTSPAEKAVLFLLLVGALTIGWRLIRRPARARKTEAGTFLDSILRGNDKNKVQEAGQTIFLFTAMIPSRPCKLLSLEPRQAYRNS